MCRFVQITDNVYLLKTPFNNIWSGVTLVKGKENFLIDTGANSETADDCIVPALDELGIAEREIHCILNTHCHGDHVGGHRRMQELSGAKICTFEKSAPKLKDISKYAAEIRMVFPEHSPPVATGLQNVTPDIVLKDGDCVGGLTLIYTPGHDDDSVCWYDTASKTLITGDSLAGNGTPASGIGFYQSLSDYRETLGRLKRLDVENIVTGHEFDGIECAIKGNGNVKECLEKCDYYTQIYDEKIRRYITEGETDSVAIAKRLIDEVGCGKPDKLFLALFTVTEHRRSI